MVVGAPWPGTPRLRWPPPHLEADAGIGELVPVLGQRLLLQGLEPALGAELVAEQGPHLCPLDGAQQDHGLCRGQ